MRERLLGPEHADVAEVMGTLAHMYREQGNLERAEPMLERARDLAERALGPDHALVADQRLRIARIDYAKGHYARAEAGFQRCLTVFERALECKRLAALIEGAVDDECLEFYEGGLWLKDIYWSRGAFENGAPPGFSCIEP